MTRFVAILLALKLAAPHWHYPQETALYLTQMEDRYHVRAELVIADAEHESRWREGVVNPISGTMGLLQIQPLNNPACRASGSLGSQACDDARDALYDWRMNLRIGFGYFAKARAYCKARGYGTDARWWLQLPTGWDSVRHSTCGHRHGKALPIPRGVSWLLNRMKELSAGSPPAAIHRKKRP